MLITGPIAHRQPPAEGAHNLLYANSFHDSRICLRSRTDVGVVASAREKDLQSIHRFD
jgi:hypothetical protein